MEEWAALSSSSIVGNSSKRGEDWAGKRACTTPYWISNILSSATRAQCFTSSFTLI